MNFNWKTAGKVLWGGWVMVCLFALLFPGPVLFAAFSVNDDGTTITISETNYKIAITKAGFKYAFKRPDNSVIAGAHATSGIRFTAPGGSTLYDASTTSLTSYDSTKVRMLVTNTNGNQATVEVYPLACYARISVVPTVSGSYTIDARTEPINPVYGLGERSGTHTNANLYGLVNDTNLRNDGSLNRFVSNFAVFPSRGFAQVLFEDKVKRVTLNSSENKIGATGVDAARKIYYFTGAMEQIYKDYKDVRNAEGYNLVKPMYEAFGVGYEAYGSVGWSTYDTVVKSDLQLYLDRGYKLEWATVGSGFWKGDRNSNYQGITTSFGIWDTTYEAGRTDGLQNPRYPDPANFKQFFTDKGIKLMLGLRTNFKAPASAGGYYNPANDGTYTQDGLDNGYYYKDTLGNPMTITSHCFPKGNLYLLDAYNSVAVDWYRVKAGLWGCAGFKEDTMITNPFHDGLFNKPMQVLADNGYLIMARNGIYTAPGQFLRIEDTFASSGDRLPMAILAFAADGNPNAYPDNIGGTGLVGDISNNDEIYMIRNTMLAAVSPIMAFGYKPWTMNNTPRSDAIKAAADWHYRITPYLYSAAVASYNTGYPYTMTPLHIAYPADPNTYNLANTTTKQYEWLLGPSLLACPLYGSDYLTASTRNVYLPEGKWMDYENGTVYSGPVTLYNYSLPEAKIPVFVGGKGVVVTRDDVDKNKFYAEVYPIQTGGSQYQYNHTDNSVTTVTNNNTGWNSALMVVTDTTAGTSVTFTHNSTTNSNKFQIIPGHNYTLTGGGGTPTPVPTPSSTPTPVPGGPVIIIDNGQTGYVETGVWYDSGLTGYNGTSTRYSHDIGSTATWTPNIGTSGNYEVFVMYPAHTNSDNDAKFTVYYNGGAQVVYVNQEINGVTWVSLGTFGFTTGMSGYVMLEADEDDYTESARADAVKFVSTSVTATPTPTPTPTPAATATPSLTPGGTLFSDDFEDGNSSGWTVVNGSWAVVTDGTKVFKQSVTTGEALAYAGNTSWTNYTVQAKVKLYGQSSGSGIIGRYQDSNNFYMFRIHNGTAKVQLYKRVAGTFTLLQETAMTININTIYTLKLVLSGNSLIGYVDGVQKVSFTDSSFTSGCIGARGFDQSFCIDEVMVN
jgi:hypothetical protein